MKPITIADEQALEELSEIFKLDVNELRYRWGDLPYQLTSDLVRMDYLRSMSDRAKNKFLLRHRSEFHRLPCPDCGEIITTRIRYIHNRSKYHLANLHAATLMHVNEI